MARSRTRRANTRAWLAIVLSYLLGLNAFVAAATPADATGFGVICSQNRTAPNKSRDHHKDHSCCTAAQCGGAAFVLGPPAAEPAFLNRVASAAGHLAVTPQSRAPSSPRRAFEARGPPPARSIA